MYTVIEYRDSSGLLRDGVFDGPLHMIQRYIKEAVLEGCYEFNCVSNPNNYDMYWLTELV